VLGVCGLPLLHCGVQSPPTADFRTLWTTVRQASMPQPRQLLHFLVVIPPNTDGSEWQRDSMVDRNYEGNAAYDYRLFRGMSSRLLGACESSVR
jgi:hypothetical protein